MATLRSRILVSDFSFCDLYCYGVGTAKKLRYKKDYHLASVNLNILMNTFPRDSSIPATDGLVVGTVADGYTNIILTNGAIIEEVGLDGTIKWTYSCPDGTWVKVEDPLPVDPCVGNTCNPCQKCVMTSPTTAICIDDCPGCETCDGTNCVSCL